MITDDISGNDLLTLKEFERLLKQIDTSSLIGLRDRAIIRLQFSAFCRLESIRLCQVDDVKQNENDLEITLSTNKGGEITLLCGDDYRSMLSEYMIAAKLAGKKEQPLFQRFIAGTSRLSGQSISGRQVHRRIADYAIAAKIKKMVGTNSIRMSGLLHFFNSGGRIEEAAAIANIRTRGMALFYDRFRQLDVLK